MRAASWVLLGLVGVAIDLSQFGRLNPASGIALAWGVFSGVASVFIFRSLQPRHGNRVRTVLVSMDLTVLAVAFDARQPFLGGTQQGDTRCSGWRRRALATRRAARP